MDQVHGVVHGPGPCGGPWIPVHVLYTFGNKSEHLSKLTLYHLKKRALRRSRRAAA